MINWDKPIETVDGRKALVIGLHPEPPGDPNDEGHFVPRMVWVESARNHLFGDVFLVMPNGVRCDDTAWRARPSVPEMREPIIRNAPVKREGWVLVEPKKNWTSDGSIVAILGSRYVYPTEQEALRAKEYHNMDLETKAVPFEWKE